MADIKDIIKKVKEQQALKQKNKEEIKQEADAVEEDARIIEKEMKDIKESIGYPQQPKQTIKEAPITPQMPTIEEIYQDDGVFRKDLIISLVNINNSLIELSKVSVEIRDGLAFLIQKE